MCFLSFLRYNAYLHGHFFRQQQLTGQENKIFLMNISANYGVDLSKLASSLLLPHFAGRFLADY